MEKTANSTQKREHIVTCEHEHSHIHTHEHECEHHHDHHHGEACACGHEHHHDHEHIHSHIGCSCGCEHDHEHGAAWVLWVRMGVAVALGVLGMFLPLPTIASTIIFIAAWIVAAYDLVIGMVKNIAHGDIFNENLLMVVASAGALAVGESFEGLAVVVLFQVGEFLQHKAVERSQASIEAMLDLRPDTANLLDEHGDVHTVRAEEVAIGASVLVRAGERVPVDGVVVSGRASFDTSAMTGESLPRAAEVGSELLSGFVSVDGAVTVRATRQAGDSAAARMVDLLRETEENKAPAESFISKFAKIYTPVVMAAAALTAIVGGAVTGQWSDWLVRALTFLVVSCPCALVLSVPLGFFSGIGGAAKKGIMVKGGATLETLGQKDFTIAFDKTGTLTEGAFEVKKVLPAKGSTADELLATAAALERGSSHPLGSAIIAAAPASTMSAVDIRELAGLGLEATVDGATARVGNLSLMARAGVDASAVDEAGTAVHVALGDRYLGAIVLGDRPKDGARRAIDAIKKLGAKRITMLTGDAKAAAQSTAAELGIDNVLAELLPEDKLRAIADERKSGATTIFVGDGINDAPVLAAADVGIAMANGQNRISVEAADAVIMSGDPEKVVDAIACGRKTRRIVRENVALALAVKAAVLVLAAMGLAPMWLAVIADVGVCLVAVVNALRALR